MTERMVEDPRAEMLRLELRLQQIQALERASSSFLSFAKYMWPEAILSAHHSRMASAFDRIVSGQLKRLIVNMPPRHAIMTSMKIPTTQGWKTMADLQVGDSVFSVDGSPTKVLGKSEVFHGRVLYRVTSDDGASLVVDGEHLWTVRLNRKRGVYHDYTTEALWRRQHGEVLRKTRGGKTEFLKGKRSVAIRLPRLPDVKPVEYEEKDLLVDPYVLGVWLGDGSRNSGVITADDKNIAFLRQEFERRGTRTTDQATRKTFGTLELQVKLKELGVLGNKHIPERYMLGSVAQRLDLLRGLMDTDGCVSKKGQCYFAQSNRAMVEDVAQLIRSLGTKASVLESEARIGDKSYGPTWRVSFYHSDCCLLPGKRERLLTNERTFGRYITVERLHETGDTQCIKIDREDGLFLAGEGYLCTHNTKSEFASYLLPAFAMGREPRSKIIQATHNGELAVRFGRKVRNLMDTDRYKEVYSEVTLQADSKAAGRWETNAGGEYFAVGVGGAMTGRGADLLIIDDPHSEQDALSELALDNAWEWYTSGPRSRLQPGGAVVVVMTRWGMKDLTARLIKSQVEPKSDQWEVIEFPAILNEHTESEKPLWPSYWSLDELQKVRATLSVQKWQSMYQQQPTNDEGAILKREWWRIWENDYTPQVEYVIQSYDTAYSKKETADYSAITTWGVFHPSADDGPAIILLDVKKGRWDFPELKRVARAQYDHWKPDNVLIEAKATGTTLQQELRRVGIPVTTYSPGGRKKNQDKIARANAVAPVFESGMVWAPQTKWAEELIEECAAFPKGDNDDLVDSTVQAISRFRAGNFVALDDDEADDPVTQLEFEYY